MGSVEARTRTGRSLPLTLLASAVLVGLAAVPGAEPLITPARASTVLTQGPGGGGGGGSDGGGSDGGSGGGVVPNPRPSDPGDGGGGEPAPAPRRPAPGGSTGTDGAARPVPPTTPQRPPDPAQPPVQPDEPNPARPSRPDPPAPVSASARSSGPAGGSGGPGSAVSGSTVLALDPETADALREYLRSRRLDANGRPLDFTTTRVTAEQWHRLIEAEGGDPVGFDAEVARLGGPDPFVTQTPVLLRDGLGGVGAATLFQVSVAGGTTRMLDAAGAHFAGIEDYLENNSLPAGWTITYPAGLSVYGDAGRLVSAAAHTRTAGQRLRELGDRVAGPVAAAAYALLPTASDVPPFARYQPGREIGVTDRNPR